MNASLLPPASCPRRPPGHRPVRPAGAGRPSRGLPAGRGSGRIKAPDRVLRLGHDVQRELMLSDRSG